MSFEDGCTRAPSSTPVANPEKRRPLRRGLACESSGWRVRGRGGRCRDHRIGRHVSCRRLRTSGDNGLRSVSCTAGPLAVEGSLSRSSGRRPSMCAWHSGRSAWTLRHPSSIGFVRRARAKSPDSRFRLRPRAVESAERGPRAPPRARSTGASMFGHSSVAASRSVAQGHGSGPAVSPTFTTAASKSGGPNIASGSLAKP